jgi:hypothetical protein
VDHLEIARTWVLFQLLEHRWARQIFRKALEKLNDPVQV